MSQAKAPREFKFVGAFSRKRRGRKAPFGTTVVTKRRAVAASTAPTEQARDAASAVSVVPASGCTDGRHSREEETEVVSMPPTEADASNIQLPMATPPLLCEQDANLVESPIILNPPTSEALINQETDIWSCSSFMNPFFDPGSSLPPAFQQASDEYQLPTYFGSDISAIPLEDTSSTDDSPQNDYFEPTSPDAMSEVISVEPAAVNQIVMSAMSPPRAPCNISLTITQLLARYDQEFCVTPLTHDFEANPFRSDAKGGRNSQLLLHCILALSYKHINRDTGSCASEARIHKRKALQLFQKTEKSTQASPMQATFLDALLILMTLDCATSAHGPWTWYLKRAYKMIQAAESSKVKKTPRTQARIEMLVWWDVTLALTSRQGCVLSEPTILSLFNHDSTSDETFYSVSGCPEALFRHMIRLGAYAREFELVSGMTCARFDAAPVLEVRRQIREWTDPQYGDFTDQQCADSSLAHGYDVGDTAQYREDLHHCAEAWRYGLLTYISRVFEWRRDEAPSPVLGFLARKTLNHVSSCRASSTLQKQLLLPVFLAGCETADEHLREVARTYCRWWNERTRYDMFLTAHALLEEVWADEDPKAWWGSVIDQKSRSGVGGGGGRQYLFG